MFSLAHTFWNLAQLYYNINKLTYLLIYRNNKLLILIAVTVEYCFYISCWQGDYCISAKRFSSCVSVKLAMCATCQRYISSNFIIFLAFYILRPMHGMTYYQHILATCSVQYMQLSCDMCWTAFVRFLTAYLINCQCFLLFCMCWQISMYIFVICNV